MQLTYQMCTAVIKEASLQTIMKYFSLTTVHQWGKYFKNFRRKINQETAFYFLSLKHILWKLKTIRSTYTSIPDDIINFEGIKEAVKHINYDGGIVSGKEEIYCDHKVIKKEPLFLKWCITFYI